MFSFSKRQKSNRGGYYGGTGEGTAKTKSYCPKHRGYKKKELITDINHREVWQGVRECEKVGKRSDSVG